jgi:hypothetical protein
LELPRLVKKAMENKCWKGREMEHAHLERWTCASVKWVILRHEWSSHYRIAHDWKRLSMVLSSNLSKIWNEAKKDRGAFLLFFSFLFLFLIIIFFFLLLFFLLSLIFFFYLILLFFILHFLCSSELLSNIVLAIAVLPHA